MNEWMKIVLIVMNDNEWRKEGNCDNDNNNNNNNDNNERKKIKVTLKKKIITSIRKKN